jgi:CcmD family protein
MDNAIYLFAAFGFSWLLIFFYVFSIIRRQNVLELKIDKIKATLENSRNHIN